MLNQKVQINLTPEEINALSLKAGLFGYSPTKYIRFLIMKEIHSITKSTPFMMISSALEKKVKKAIKEHKKGRSHQIKTIDELDKL